MILALVDELAVLLFGVDAMLGPSRERLCCVVAAERRLQRIRGSTLKVVLKVPGLFPSCIISL